MIQLWFQWETTIHRFGLHSSKSHRKKLRVYCRTLDTKFMHFIKQLFYLVLNAVEYIVALGVDL